MKAAIGSRVHVTCRKRFIDKKDIESKKIKLENSENVSKKRKSGRVPVYNDESNCLFCNTLVDFTSNLHLKKCEPQKVRTHDFASSILECCKQRSDDWSFNVSGKIEYYQRDLHAADCVYHQSCSVNFRTGKQVILATIYLEVG